MEVTLENFLEFTGKSIDNILEPINHHTCMGFTNKTSFTQCKCKPKHGDFCGRHKKTNRRYDIFFKHFTEPDKENNKITVFSIRMY